MRSGTRVDRRAGAVFVTDCKAAASLNEASLRTAIISDSNKAVPNH